MSSHIYSWSHSSTCWRAYSCICMYACVFFSFAPKVSHALMRQYEMLDGFSITWQTQTTYQKIDSLHISPLFNRFSVQAHVIVFAEMIQKRCFSSTDVAFNKYRKWLLAGWRYFCNNTLHSSRFLFTTNTYQIRREYFYQTLFQKP